MEVIRLAVLTLIMALSLVFLVAWVISMRCHPDKRWPSRWEFAIGLVTDFFDALGIGSFPTSTSLFRLGRLVREEDIPGTLNVGHAPAAVVEALVFITAVAVDPLLLGMMTAGTMAGAWLGAGYVLRLPRLALQWVLGVGTLVAALLFVAVNLHLLPGGGDAFFLTGWRFCVATVGSVLLGSLMAAGVGLFGPCMIMLALLGMHPLAAFPVMMAAGCVQQLVSGTRYARAGRYAFGMTLGLGLGGVIGALVASLMVRSLPVGILRWLVAVVALYVAVDFLFAAVRTGAGKSLPSGAAAD